MFCSRILVVGGISMYINGEVYTKFSVESFDLIKQLCEEIGVLEKDGTVAKIEKDQIVTYELDIFDKTNRVILYDKPYDVKLASTLINLYEQAKEYVDLPEGYREDAEKRNSYRDSNYDYKTAYRLQLKR